jgi:hypothetical protein
VSTGSIHAAGLDHDLPPAPTAIPAEATAVPEGTHVIVTPPPASMTPAAGDATEEDEHLEHLEPDAELLRRIREA